jgi:outer membrane lipoprotein SlyB
LLAGLGAFVLPGIGAVVAAGWLASALAGAMAGGAAGGVVGALIEAGISKRDATAFAEGVRRGDNLVTIRVASQDRDFYQRILAGIRRP